MASNNGVKDSCMLYIHGCAEGVLLLLLLAAATVAELPQEVDGVSSALT
jgi:hypothetical protein